MEAVIGAFQRLPGCLAGGYLQVAAYQRGRCEQKQLKQGLFE